MSELVNSRKKALEETVEFWQALSQTGRLKISLIRSNKYFEKFTHYHELCALCEYTKDATGDFSANCKKCPVDWAVFPSLERCEPPGIRRPQGQCLRPSSPFWQWEFAETREGRKKWAMEVANLAKRTLKEGKENG